MPAGETRHGIGVSPGIAVGRGGPGAPTGPAACARACLRRPCGVRAAGS